MNNWRGGSGPITRLGRFPLIWLLAFGAAGALAGCSSDPVAHRDVEQTGSLGVELKVAEGVTLNSVTYSITGNGFTKAGTIDARGALTVSGTIGGIPSGKGY